jgi:hypothetical protein
MVFNEEFRNEECLTNYQTYCRQHPKVLFPGKQKDVDVI